MLAKGSRFVSQEVIECLLENPNKRYYPAIKKFFVTASNAHSVHRLIKTLPGLDLTKELPQAWEYSRGDGNPFAVSYLMPDVLAVGYLPAFRFLFEALERERDGDRRIATFDSASMIRQYSFATGEKAELKAWYAKNKYSLSFDHQSGRFVSAEDRQHMDKR
jgi:hypothetical protein